MSRTASWMSEKLIEQVRLIFEPRYKRIISDFEATEIAENLEAVVEEVLKLKWRQRYETTI